MKVGIEGNLEGSWKGGLLWRYTIVNAHRQLEDALFALFLHARRLVLQLPLQLLHLQAVQGWTQTMK